MKIGISDAVVVGDTRFDRVLQIKEASKKLPLVEKFVNRDAADRKKVFVAGSSWQPDEEIFLKYLMRIRTGKLIMHRTLSEKII